MPAVKQAKRSYSNKVFRVIIFGDFMCCLCFFLLLLPFLFIRKCFFKPCEGFILKEHLLLIFYHFILKGSHLTEIATVFPAALKINKQIY